MFGRLVAVAPFGVNEEPPVRTGPGIRASCRASAPTTRSLLWGGGLYDWFDPLTLIRAVDVVKDKVPGVRMVFLGTAHPNPKVGTMQVVAQARALADELASPVPTCSSTTPGCPTTSARTSCSTPTSA